MPAIFQTVGEAAHFANIIVKNEGLTLAEVLIVPPGDLDRTAKEVLGKKIVVIGALDLVQPNWLLITNRPRR